MALIAALAFVLLADQEKPGNAAADWQRILDELTPKIVAFRTSSPKDREKQTFAAERTQVLDYFRRYEKSDPDKAWLARVWLATNLTRDALQRDRESADDLLAVTRDAASAEAASLAAIEAGVGLLKLADESGLERLEQIYSARADRSPAVVSHLADLRHQVRLRPGRPFPELVLTDLSARAVDWKQLRGKVVVVLAFNVESDPSRQALARVAALAASHAAEPFAVVGISLDVDRTRLVAELDRLKATFPVDFSGKEWSAPAAKELGLAKIPITFVLDPTGTIVDVRNGPLPPAFEEGVEKTLRAARDAAPAGGK